MVAAVPEVPHRGFRIGILPWLGSVAVPFLGEEVVRSSDGQVDDKVELKDKRAD